MELTNTHPITVKPQVGTARRSDAEWYGRIEFGHPTYVYGESIILPGNATLRQNGYGETIAYCYGLSFKVLKVHRSESVSVEPYRKPRYH